MYTVLFYEDGNGFSEIYEQYKKLLEKSVKSKDARIQFKQITMCIELLKEKGNNLPAIIAKHLFDKIWELRPGKNRVLYFFHKDDTFVLLHMFRKKTQKTPKSEIEKAIKEANDYLLRKGN